MKTQSNGDEITNRTMTAPQPAPRIDRLFRALADKTRLRILHRLLGGTMCVGDIATVLLIPQPAVSRHLAYLRKAGLVQVRRAGQWCYYSVAPARSRSHQKLVECLADCVADLPEAQADVRRVHRLKKAWDCPPCANGPRGDESARARPGGASVGDPVRSAL